MAVGGAWSLLRVLASTLHWIFLLPEALLVQPRPTSTTGLTQGEGTPMRKNHKILGTVAIAGLVAAAGSAFTGGGLTNATKDQFVGGTVTENVSGATLTNVAYSYADNPAHTQVDSVNLTFSGPHIDGRSVSIVFNGGGVSFTCDPIDGTTTTCVPTVEGTSQSNVTSLDVSVASAEITPAP